MHTINLCAKSILKHFDLPKRDDKKALDHAANALVDLADNINYKAGREQERGNNDKKQAHYKEYLEVWASICDGLADNKIQELKLSVHLARSMLGKVCPSL